MHEPQAPSNIPKYLREGLQKQSASRLRAIAEYAERLADYHEERAEEEMQERVEQGREETPEEWSDDEWESVVESSGAPAKASVTTKTIDGNQYYYFQWREKDKICSEYLAPVNPAD